jgi:hypothetical protein
LNPIYSKNGERVLFVGLDTVAPIFNPSYSGGGDQEECSSKPVQHFFSINKPGMMVLACDPRFKG